MIEENAKCNILLISGSIYNKDILNDIQKKIKFNKLFILSSNLMEGVPHIEDIRNILGKPRLLVSSRKHLGNFKMKF